MATLSASRRNSANSTPNTPRPSISGNSVQKMSSLEEEMDPISSYAHTNGLEDTKEVEGVDEIDEQDKIPEDLDQELVAPMIIKEISNKVEEMLGNKVTNLIQSLEEVPVIPNKVVKDLQPKVIKEIRDEVEGNKIRTRACSERSDSGISDCSSHITSSSCTSTPLLGKKFKIKEEAEFEEPKKTYVSTTTLVINQKTDELNKLNKIEELHVEAPINRPSNLNLIPSKLNNFNSVPVVKPHKSPGSSSSLINRVPIYSSRSVADAIKKFDKLDSTPPESPPTPNKLLTVVPAKEPSPIRQKSPNRLINIIAPEAPVRKLSATNLDKSPDKTTVRYRCPSPSLLRKTQAVIAKEQCNEYYVAKQQLLNPNAAQEAQLVCPKSPTMAKKPRDKPKSESFQKAAAFWNAPKT